jgi:preprotein translocase subunit SecY
MSRTAVISLKNLFIINMSCAFYRTSTCEDKQSTSSVIVIVVVVVIFVFVFVFVAYRTVADRKIARRHSYGNCSG